MDIPGQQCGLFVQLFALICIIVVASLRLKKQIMLHDNVLPLSISRLSTLIDISSKFSSIFTTVGSHHAIVPSI